MMMMDERFSMQDDEIEKMLDRALRNRHVPQAPVHLAHAIVAAASTHPQAGGGLRRAVGGFFAEFGRLFAIPRPVFALAVFLLLGLSAGIFMDTSSMFPALMPELMPEDLAGFLTIDDRFVAGEWL
ncbi:MAG: hypothetical protein IT559_00570 [Alphaproteobacteria bacterium]|nr:hypothetical protein [Alphaproteobacteria bacterium]